MNALYLAQTSVGRLDPVAFVRASAAAGFDGIGIRLNPSPGGFGGHYHPVLGNAPLIAELKRIIADSGLEVLDIFSFYLKPTTNVAAFMPAIELGAELGAKYLLVQGYDPDWSRMRDTYAALCDRAAPFGISPALEFMPARPLSTIGLADKLIRESGRANTAILIDPVHLARGGGTPADVRAIDPRLLLYVQLSDGILRPDEPDLSRLGQPQPLGERRLLGRGTLPVAELLAYLPEDLPISIEIGNMTAEPMADETWVRVVHDTSREYLAKRRRSTASGQEDSTHRPRTAQTTAMTRARPRRGHHREEIP